MKSQLYLTNDLTSLFKQWRHNFNEPMTLQLNETNYVTTLSTDESKNITIVA